MADLQRALPTVLVKFKFVLSCGDLAVRDGTWLLHVGRAWLSTFMLLPDISSGHNNT